MLKRNITYTDFNGDEVSEIFYFNLTKSELVKLEVHYNDGLEGAIRRIIKTEDRKALIEEFQRIILLAYGEKSDDGKRFVKNDTIRDAFSQHAAFDTLFIELATNEQAAADFIKGVLPSDMQSEMDRGSSQLPPPNMQPAEEIHETK